MSESNTWRIGYIDDNLDFCQLLGIFVARWSLVEFSLMMPLVLVTGASQEIATGILASTPGTKGKIGLVRAAVKQSVLPDEDKKVIVKLLSRLDSI